MTQRPSNDPTASADDTPLLSLSDALANGVQPTEDEDEDTIEGEGVNARVLTRREMVLRQAFVEQLIMRGMGTNAIIDAARSKMNLTASQTRTAITKVKDRWKGEYDQDRAYWKLSAIKRTQQAINRLNTGKPGKAGEEAKHDHNMILKYEMFLSDLQGTKDPIKVDLATSFNEAVVGIVGGMTEAEIQQLAGEFDENQRLANVARKMGLDVIDTIGEEVK